MKQIVISDYRTEKVSDNVSKMLASVAFKLGDGKVQKETLWFELEHPSHWMAPVQMDCFLLAMLMDGMLANAKLVIEGGISLSLLRNIDEYQRAWHCCLPEQYSVIDISVENTNEEPNICPPSDDIIVPYSGGVDSTFSLYSHLVGAQKHSSRPVGFGLLVQGFDIPLDQTEKFDIAYSKAHKSLADYSLQLRKLSTNIREISKVNWEYSHGTGVAAAGYCYSSIIRNCLIGSNEPYNQLVFPWGSSPITDHLMSSNSMRIIHDSAGYSRNAKVALISKWQQGKENLRVCWQSRSMGDNCGKCEKCVRTMFNFYVANESIPDSFNAKHDWQKATLFVRLKSHATLSEWLEIQKELHKQPNKLYAKMLVGLLIFKSKSILILMPSQSRRYALLVKLYRKLLA